MYLGSPGKTGNRARLLKELDQLAAQGITNLRVLAISESSTLKRSVTPAVVLRPNHIGETLWQGLDFLLAEMAKRDRKAVLYLNSVEDARQFRRRSAAGAAGPLLRIRFGRLDGEHHRGARAPDEWSALAPVHRSIIVRSAVSENGLAR